MRARALLIGPVALGVLAMTCQAALAQPLPSPTALPSATATASGVPRVSGTHSGAPAFMTARSTAPAGRSTEPSSPAGTATSAASVPLPGAALAAIGTVPDYDVDPLLLAGLESKLRQAKAAAATLDMRLAGQRKALGVLSAQAEAAASRARTSRRLTDARRSQLVSTVRNAYMATSTGASPALVALTSSAPASAEDALSTISLTQRILDSQTAQMERAVFGVRTAAAASNAAQVKVRAAQARVTKVRDDAQKARNAVALAQAAIDVRIASVRRDLAIRRAVQAVTGAGAVHRWRVYLAELRAGQVDPPPATALNDPARLPHGMSAVADASGNAQAGVAQVRLSGRSTLVLSRQAIAAVDFAFAQLGKPYVWAAVGPNSFDCSGLMLSAYRAAGVTGLPRVAKDQFTWAAPVGPGQEMPGDLVFFAGSDGTVAHPGHVGMVVDPVRHLMIQAPQSGDVVKVSSYAGWSGLAGFGRVTTVGR